MDAYHGESTIDISIVSYSVDNTSALCVWRFRFSANTSSLDPRFPRIKSETYVAKHTLKQPSTINIIDQYLIHNYYHMKAILSILSFKLSKGDINNIVQNNYIDRLGTSLRLPEF